MKIKTSIIIVLTIVSGYSFGQNNTSLIKSIQSNNYYCSNKTSVSMTIKSIQPVKYYLVSSGGLQNPLTLKYYPRLAFTKFYFESEKPASAKDDNEEISQSKWEWLYFAGTVLAAVIVYLVWPEKSPESKQTLTFGKPLPPR
jgi:hypothetical protein